MEGICLSRSSEFLWTGRSYGAWI